MTTRTNSSKVSSRKTSPRKTLHAKRFPGETPEYRKLRDKLLKAEIALRKQVESVAELRRALPAGGAVP